MKKKTIYIYSLVIATPTKAEMDLGYVIVHPYKYSESYW